MNKKKFLKGLVLVGIGYYFIQTPSILGLAIGGIGYIIGWFNIVDSLKRIQVERIIKNSFCFYCEKYKARIYVISTPEGKKYAWNCDNCKRKSEGFRPIQ